MTRDRKDGKGYKTMHQDKTRLQDRTKLKSENIRQKELPRSPDMMYNLGGGGLNNHVMGQNVKIMGSYDVTTPR
jgi:hypothetical protein